VGGGELVAFFPTMTNSVAIPGDWLAIFYGICQVGVSGRWRQEGAQSAPLFAAFALGVSRSAKRAWLFALRDYR